MNIAAEIAELRRRIDNLIRTGVVTDVNLKSATCRVSSGAIKTDWLSWMTCRAGNSRVWWAPSAGEQVLLFSLSGNPEAGIVLPALFSDTSPPPSQQAETLYITMPDGAEIIYDAQKSALSATGIKTATISASDSISATTRTATITASASVTLKAPVVECTGLLKTGSLEVTGGGKMSGNINHTGGEFSSNGVVVHTHRHSGVEPGGGSSGGPQS
ncbi:phage baseplate assembly protein V [Salmonella enterica]|nr:phage baseplate assembly protein V [Salmonella enterica]